MRSRFFAIVVVIGICFSAQAASIEKPLADPVQEQQARELFSAMKCVVCEGQSLADSDATLALQMRAHIRAMLEAGESPQQVTAYFRASYGDRILMQPPMKSQTAILWLLPLLLFAFGGWLLLRFTKKRASPL